MTLQQVAEFTDLSVGYLSLIERGRTSPTVANLHKICQALNITMADLFVNMENDNKCVRKENRRLLFDDPGRVKYEALTEGSRSIVSMCMHVLDEQVHEAVTHVADECGFIIQGSMILTIEGIEYSVGEGDSIYIPAGSAHSFCRTSDCPCISIWTAPAANYPFVSPSVFAAVRSSDSA
jgi:mannose-6-phosphate isomerase-like protein (cupin superfamily)